MSRPARLLLALGTTLGRSLGSTQADAALALVQGRVEVQQGLRVRREPGPQAAALGTHALTMPISKEDDPAKGVQQAIGALIGAEKALVDAQKTAGNIGFSATVGGAGTDSFKAASTVGFIKDDMAMGSLVTGGVEGEKLKGLMTVGVADTVEKEGTFVVGAGEVKPGTFEILGAMPGENGGVDFARMQAYVTTGHAPVNFGSFLHTLGLQPKAALGANVSKTAAKATVGARAAEALIKTLFWNATNHKEQQHAHLTSNMTTHLASEVHERAGVEAHLTPPKELPRVLAKVLQAIAEETQEGKQILASLPKGNLSMSLAPAAQALGKILAVLAAGNETTVSVGNGTEVSKADKVVAFPSMRGLAAEDEKHPINPGPLKSWMDVATAHPSGKVAKGFRKAVVEGVGQLVKNVGVKAANSKEAKGAHKRFDKAMEVAKWLKKAKDARVFPTIFPMPFGFPGQKESTGPESLLQKGARRWEAEGEAVD
eukprot:CAMPEP_0168405538 /NCGR_PEP_ID=MMETSP0228-20121227/25192_1 /TAXON_ID=133427 /ORGANISM="Protoceratium reticulatum, Strain CCCM 535 (=CCMP 1889)" /LENGTH=484 /DNA_ID=CAMNT_0008419167 /DNA_START=43 /DNA_END=1494 /DNA_ORIENTATION=+